MGKTVSVFDSLTSADASRCEIESSYKVITTVKPVYSGHLRYQEKCPLSTGVRYIEGFLIGVWPLFFGLVPTKVSVMYKCPLCSMSAIYRFDCINASQKKKKTKNFAKIEVYNNEMILARVFCFEFRANVPASIFEVIRDGTYMEANATLEYALEGEVMKKNIQIFYNRFQKLSR